MGFVAIMFEKVNNFGGYFNLGVSVADVSWVFKMAYLGDLFVMMLHHWLASIGIQTVISVPGPFFCLDAT